MILPFDLFLVVAATIAMSFYVHVYLDKEYHVAGSKLVRFAWFRRKQQLHFVHHLHADSNFAVIDFFWDNCPAPTEGPIRTFAKVGLIVALVHEPPGTNRLLACRRETSKGEPGDWRVL